MTRTSLALLLLPVLACKTGSPGTLAGAAATTGLAVGAAAASRAAGGCIAICTGESFCNAKTGLCESLPCRGKCSFGEHCAQTLTEIRCVPDGTTGVEAARAAGSSKAPAVAPIVTAPNATTGSPTIVPAAEQQPPK
ncbi:MAG TPA: hypothetical protein VE755_10500 [Myxococcales bacterium]|jgi:hypothetical protein|nr:hypothetical protein [Myxococcales bacterium]